MRSTELVLGTLEDRRHVPATPTLLVPKSSAKTPIVFEPHPALRTGGWYQGPDQEVLRPGWYPVRRPADKSAGSALLWTFFFGPLGLFYLSAGAGVAATVAGAAALVLSGSAATLAAIWPVAMVVSLLYATRR